MDTDAVATAAVQLNIVANARNLAATAHSKKMKGAFRAPLLIEIPFMKRIKRKQALRKIARIHSMYDGPYSSPYPKKPPKKKKKDKKK